MGERLTVLGWDERVAAEFAPHAARGLEPARVALEHQHIYRLYTEDGECLARVRGRIRHQAEAREAFPAVGDWVAIEPFETPSESTDREAAIAAVLPRRSRFSRKSAGDLTGRDDVSHGGRRVALVAGQPTSSPSRP